MKRHVARRWWLLAVPLLLLTACEKEEDLYGPFESVDELMEALNA